MNVTYKNERLVEIVVYLKMFGFNIHPAGMQVVHGQNFIFASNRNSI